MRPLRITKPMRYAVKRKMFSVWGANDGFYFLALHLLLATLVVELTHTIVPLLATVEPLLALQ